MDVRVRRSKINQMVVVYCILLILYPLSYFVILFDNNTYLLKKVFVCTECSGQLVHEGRQILCEAKEDSTGADEIVADRYHITHSERIPGCCWDVSPLIENMSVDRREGLDKGELRRIPPIQCVPGQNGDVSEVPHDDVHRRSRVDTQGRVKILQYTERHTNICKKYYDT